MAQNPAKRFSWQSFGIWVAITTAAFFLSADLHLQASGVTTPFNPRDLEIALFGFVFGAVSGMISGALQWLALKPWLPNFRHWILVNVIGFGLVHAMHDTLPYRPLDLWLILLIDGTVIGLAQYFGLRHSITKAGLWVPIFAAGWFLGFQSAFAILWSFNSSEVLVERAIELGITGLIAGVITGLALKFLIIPVEPAPRAQSSRWVNMRGSKKTLMLFFFTAAAVVVLILFARLFLGIG